jgi:hypothetical protein
MPNRGYSGSRPGDQMRPPVQVPSASVPRKPTWQQGVQPTAQQLADWLVVCHPSDRLATVEAMLRLSRVAQDCVARQHELMFDPAYRRQPVWWTPEGLR